ncbi:MAG: L,D-transpeptidase family protein [Myxococcales bacterium]|nr:L,D-transpeptidase family protein [Myxococcales bacterium]
MILLCVVAWAVSIASPIPLWAEGTERADRVKLYKSERRLLLLREGRILGQYAVALGQNPEGPKHRAGDGKTPEGRYVLDWRNPESRYYRSIHLSYPNPRDLERAQTKRIDPGGGIMIHGLPNGLGFIGEAHRTLDWTDGCIAVTNSEMDEIWRRVPDGTPIEIWP